MIGQTNKKQSGFLFGGDTGMSYEQLQSRKKIADALAANVYGRAPQNIGEGLQAIGDALAYRGMMRKIEKGEAQGKDKARGMIVAALQGRKPEPYASSTGPMTINGIPPRSEDQAIGDETMMALGRHDMVGASDFDFNNYAVGGAATRGDSFTGLQPEMQTALMPFLQAADRELGPGALKVTSAYRSPELQAQLYEAALQKYGSPEAARKWVAPPGHSQHNKGTAIDFAGADGGLLRDASSREAQWIKANAAKYGLAVPMDWEPWQVELAGARGQASAQSAQPPQQDYSAFYEALSSPWLDQSQKAMLMAEMEDRKAADNRAYDRWSQQNDPLRQLQLERAQLELEQMQNPQPGFSVLTPEQETQYGLDPSGTYQQGANGKISQIGGGGTNVSVTTGGSVDVPEYPKAPTGFMYVRDPVTGQVQLNEQGIATMAPILGGPAANEAQELEEKEANKDRQAKLKLGTTLTSIGLNLAEIDNGGLPVTGAVGDARRTWVGQLLTGSDAVDFGNRTNQITDSAAFAEIQNMRDNSPTGGAVGQLTDKERTAIGNAVTALNNSTSAEEYARAAKAYQQLALNIAYGEGSWELLEDGTVQATTGGTTAPAVGDTSGFATMDLNELINLDVDALTPAQQDAVSRRLEELGY